MLLQSAPERAINYTNKHTGMYLERCTVNARSTYTGHHLHSRHDTDVLAHFWARPIQRHKEAAK